ncbi:MAG TPA: hypothetical protein VJS91_09655, partial [Nitrososphaeraceae archaeon]|nr:hypothetical protein [Nitrososphaeraceae archaeon]
MKDELKEQAKLLRKQGISIIKIAKQLGVAKSSVSVWTKGITLSEKQKQQLLHREISDTRAISLSNTFKLRRQQYQDRGKERIKQGDPLYVAGCMLYWGEGSKEINQCRMVNSELPMLVIFKSFLEKFFDVSNDMLSIAINAYTDIRTQEEIENYWIDGLSLSKSSLKKSIWNQYPTSSKKKAKKSEYGTCALMVSRTEIVQEIFGAIQEFGEFSNENWLSKVKGDDMATLAAEIKSISKKLDSIRDRIVTGAKKKISDTAKEGYKDARFFHYELIILFEHSYER